MHKLSQNLTNKLNTLNQRPLQKGEIFLLAKAISDNLPLMPPQEENVRLFILSHKRFIDEVIYTLNMYTYLDNSKVEVLEKLICELTLWRASVAHKPIIPIFSDCPTSVIDDISNLLRFVDKIYMCAVGDIIENANYMTDLFYSLVSEVKAKLTSTNETLRKQNESN